MNEKENRTANDVDEKKNGEKKANANRPKRMVKRTLYPRLLNPQTKWDDDPYKELEKKYPMPEKVEGPEAERQADLHCAMRFFLDRECEMLGFTYHMESSENSFGQVDVQYEKGGVRRNIRWESSERLDRLIEQLTCGKYMPFSEMQFLFYHVWRYVNFFGWNGYGPSEQGFFDYFGDAWKAYVALPATPVTVEYDVDRKDY